LCGKGNNGGDALALARFVDRSAAWMLQSRQMRTQKKRCKTNRPKNFIEEGRNSVKSGCSSNLQFG